MSQPWTATPFYPLSRGKAGFFPPKPPVAGGNAPPLSLFEHTDASIDICSSAQRSGTVAVQHRIGLQICLVSVMNFLGLSLPNIASTSTKRPISLRLSVRVLWKPRSSPSTETVRLFTSEHGLPTLPYRFDTGVALFAKRTPRPFPPPFLSPPSGSFSDPLSTHDQSRDRRARVNGDIILGKTNGDDAVFASDYFICANDGVGAWTTRPRGHAGYARLNPAERLFHVATQTKDTG